MYNGVMQTSVGNPLAAAWRLAQENARLVLFTVAAKLLLTHAYYSTDMEVHRNWLAITHNLPLHEWYYENTSQWTLDYPPLFAYFEWVLSQFARVLAPQALQHSNFRSLQISATPIHDASVVLFHRFSVALTDVCLYAAVCAFAAAAATYYEWSSSTLSSRGRVLCLLTLTHAGLTLVDNIHFQYNGLIISVLITVLTFAYLRQPMGVAIVFTLLVLLKHLFLVLAPAVGVYILADAYMRAAWEKTGAAGFVMQIAKVAAVVLTIAIVIIGPVIWRDPAAHTLQLLSRLFPFERGLVHAYWAPNVWALYMAGDRLTRALLRKVSWADLCASANSATTSNNATCLPAIAPRVANAITLVAVLIPVIRLWRRPSAAGLHAAVVGSYIAAFAFGWHVHEKAVLYFTVPLQLLSVVSPEYATINKRMMLWSLVALMPLIFTPLEQPVVLAINAAYVALCDLLDDAHDATKSVSWKVPLFVVIVYQALTATMASLEFLPLMFLSICCSIALSGAFVEFLALRFPNHVAEADADKRRD